MALETPHSGGDEAPKSTAELGKDLMGLRQKDQELREAYGAAADQTARDKALVAIQLNAEKMQKAQVTLGDRFDETSARLDSADALDQRVDKKEKGLTKLSEEYTQMYERVEAIKALTSDEKLKSIDPKELGKLNAERTQLERKMKRIMDPEDGSGKLERRGNRVDARLNFGDFDSDKQTDRAQLRKQAEKEREIATAEMEDIQAALDMGLGEDPELDAKAKAIQKRLDAADQKIADLDQADQDDKKEASGEDKEGAPEAIETEHEKMVGRCLRFANFLSLNPPIEDIQLDKQFQDRVQVSLVNFAFRWSLSASGQDGLKALKDLGENNQPLQNLRDYMGFTIKEETKDGKTKLKYKFDKDLINKEKVEELKRMREAGEIRDPKERAYDTHKGKLEGLARNSMQEMLKSEDGLVATLKAKEVGLDANLGEYFQKVLDPTNASRTDKMDVRTMMQEAFNNEYILADLRAQMKGLAKLEGDELNKAILDLGFKPDQYEEAMKDGDLTDEELQGFLVDANFSEKLPVFEGLTVRGVVLDLYKESGEKDRQLLTEQFAGDETMLKLFKAYPAHEDEDTTLKLLLEGAELNDSQKKEAALHLLNESFGTLGFAGIEISDGSMQVLDFLILNISTRLSEETDMPALDSIDQKVDFILQHMEDVVSSLADLDESSKAAQRLALVQVIKSLDGVTLEDAQQALPGVDFGYKPVVEQVPAESSALPPETFIPIDAEMGETLPAWTRPRGGAVNTGWQSFR